MQLDKGGSAMSEETGEDGEKAASSEKASPGVGSCRASV